MAGKNIKGITIKIDGDTTNLGKALKDVDQQVYGLNNDLKALNQALKLDPKNTELLAQKQDVLARNIAETKNRLQTLVEAQRQMGDYNSLTDEQKKSYNQLSLEIAKSENALKEMNKELKESSGIDLGKLKDGLKKVGDVALNVTKQVAKFGAAAGGALAGVVAAGVKSYASLEQNIGGIETLFGNGGLSVEEYAKKVGKSTKDVQGEYDKLTKAQELAMTKAAQGYESAGLSANEYMETITSFAASLKQSMKNADPSDIVKAADQAVIDMSDNANKMGTDMSAIQNAYQGFAKQNYTMLDNLKLGYGGTKTEMQRLLKDAEKFSGVKYDINNLNDVYSAIHVVQEELGIAGTTADEAATTISGSANAMKAAFDNFINGSGSPEQLAKSVTTFLTNIGNVIAQLAPSILSGIVQLIQTLIPQVATLLAGLLPQLVTAVQNLISQLVNLIVSNQEQIANFVTSLINQVIQALATILPVLLQGVMATFTAVLNGLAAAIPQIVPVIMEAINTIIFVLIENFPALLEAAITLLMALVEAIPTIIDALIDAIPMIIDCIIDTLLKDGPTMLATAYKLLFEIIKAIPHIMISLATAIPKIVVQIAQSLWAKRGDILKTGKDLLIKLKDGIVEKVPELLEKAKEIPGKIKDKIKEGLEKIKDVGKDLMNGLWEGIQDKWNGIKDKVESLGKGIVKKFKSVFGIKSPSKVFKNEIGHWMAAGIEEGFIDTMDKATTEMTKSIPIDALVNDVNGAMKGLTRGMQNSINPQINPNISLEQNYKQMAEAMKEALDGTEVTLDDREVGRIVTKTITEEIFN